MVGVNQCFYGVRIDHIQKEVVLCHILYLHQKMEFLNSCRVGQLYFEDCLSLKPANAKKLALY